MGYCGDRCWDGKMRLKISVVEAGCVGLVGRLGWEGLARGG